METYARKVVRKHVGSEDEQERLLVEIKETIRNRDIWRNYIRDEKETYWNVGKRYDITVERVRQIVYKVTRKMLIQKFGVEYLRGEGKF